jgi:hypothetical protein
MNLNIPPIAHLRSMLVLHEKRARVQSELDAIDQQISKHQSQLGVSLSSPAAQASSAPQKRGPRAKRKGTARGALKAQIFSALEKAGAAGVKVIPLAEQLGTKSANVYAWFHAAVKRYKGTIKKIGGAHYSLTGKAPAHPPAKAAKQVSAPGKSPKAVQATKAPKAPKAGKRGGSPRGHLRDGIVATLKAAGSSGATINDLSNKLGVKYKNIAVWFATTGRKNKSIKKIAPATYQLVG